MAEALIKGLLKAKYPADKILASDISAERRSYLAEAYEIKVTADNQEAADFGETIILAVKPQFLREAVKNLKVKTSRLIISIAAGITIGYLEEHFKENPVIRAMPNNPALVGAGITALASGSQIKKDHLETARRIFEAVGSVVEISENLMDAVTGLSGSGPAFVYLFLEAMAEAGEGLGITKSLAEKLALETIWGSAETMKKTKKSPRELREMVTSKGGTTQEGLRVLEEQNFKAALISAISAAARRAGELSKEWT
jgi:pyrroline-5-carboxylate reductase